MTAVGIGAKLRQERVGKGLAIDDISRDTRIAPRFLEAIETEDYSSLPGLVFTRNFVRQYALLLNLDPAPLLAALPKPDETTAPLPNPPLNPRSRSSYRRERRMQALLHSAVWLLVAAVAGGCLYLYLNHYSIRVVTPETSQGVVQAAGPKPATPPLAVAEAAPPEGENPSPELESVAEGEAAAPASTASNNPAPVEVSLTAHARAWIRLTVDGKTVFIGTLAPNETKEVSATGQVNLLTGNAGGLTVSLNGKTLDSLGRTGEMREVRLTAEGPEFLSKDPRPQQTSDQL